MKPDYNYRKHANCTSSIYATALGEVSTHTAALSIQSPKADIRMKKLKLQKLISNLLSFKDKSLCESLLLILQGECTTGKEYKSRPPEGQ